MNTGATNCDQKMEFPQPNTVIVYVECMENFILRTKDKYYTLNFKKLLEDYGIEKDLF